MSEFEKRIFGERLRQCRKESGMKQRVFCEQVGISQGNLSAYEVGRLSPPVEKLVLIADALNVSLDYLCGRTDEK